MYACRWGPSSAALRQACRLHRNSIGLFWCWGVKYGLAEANHVDGNSRYGVSIGHNDTDNVMRNNRILNSGKVGILFRDESRGQDFWANRNLVEKNQIIDSGDDSGVGIDVQGRTKDVRIIGNEIRETRQPANRVGIRVSADARRIELRDNVIEGFSKDVLDQRPS